MESDSETNNETWRSLQRAVAPLIVPQLSIARQGCVASLLSALEKYLISSIQDYQSAKEFLHRIPDVYNSCNEPIYDRPLVAEAYAYIHLASRYCGWWEVFTELLSSGWLPMREAGLQALDVGAGPGPASYALIDFSRTVVETILRLDNYDQFRRLLTPKPEVVMVESSRAMSHFVHILSEIRGLGGPFGASFDDFFALRLARTREINAQIRYALESRIMEKWDVGTVGAEWILQEDYPGWDQPDRYHLCLMSNFLTLPEVLDHASEALRGVKETLPAGGTIAVVGSPGQDGPYAAIYRELQRQMRGLHHLKVSGPYQPQIDDPVQVSFRTFYGNVNRHIEALGVDAGEELSSWPDILQSVRRRWLPDNRVRIPKFRVEVFRAGNERMSRRYRRPNRAA